MTRHTRDCASHAEGLVRFCDCGFIARVPDDDTTLASALALLSTGPDHRWAAEALLEAGARRGVPRCDTALRLLKAGREMRAVEMLAASLEETA